MNTIYIWIFLYLPLLWMCVVSLIDEQLSLIHDDLINSNILYNYDHLNNDPEIQQENILPNIFENGINLVDNIPNAVHKSEILTIPFSNSHIEVPSSIHITYNEKLINSHSNDNSEFKDHLLNLLPHLPNQPTNSNGFPNPSNTEPDSSGGTDHNRDSDNDFPNPSGGTTSHTTATPITTFIHITSSSNPSHSVSTTYTTNPITTSIPSTTYTTNPIITSTHITSSSNPSHSEGTTYTTTNPITTTSTHITNPSHSEGTTYTTTNPITTTTSTHITSSSNPSHSEGTTSTTANPITTSIPSTSSSNNENHGNSNSVHTGSSKPNIGTIIGGTLGGLLLVGGALVGGGLFINNRRIKKERLRNKLRRKKKRRQDLTSASIGDSTIVSQNSVSSSVLPSKRPLKTSVIDDSDSLVTLEVSHGQTFDGLGSTTLLPLPAIKINSGDEPSSKSVSNKTTKLDDYSQTFGGLGSVTALPLPIIKINNGYKPSNKSASKKTRKVNASNINKEIPKGSIHNSTSNANPEPQQLPIFLGNTTRKKVSLSVSDLTGSLSI
ncbi:hypothetical protein cand_022470 [Cryptosporidium andersoni]|uniref:Uncharacterized protein n=1 Tax=Cryptosporidium andersoni TaxID=117008 RepID=A0A1J4MRT8_9CRYT|nr:hypothetical protein cand_022470 [Cryptosporidium andersoni]